jgi:MATE family multidrug resistance protein
MFVGRVSAEAIGAVGLGTAIFYGVVVTASGLLLGLDTFVARAFGAGDGKACRHSLISALWLSLLLVPPVTGAVLGFLPLLSRFGTDAGVLQQARPYLRTLAWSAPPLLAYFGLRRYLQATGREQPVMLALVLANFINIAGNWILVFGNLGAPRMGAEGSAWATFLSRTFLAVMLAVVVARQDPEFFHDVWKPDWPRIRKLWNLGLPAAGQIGVEVAVFGTVTVLVSKTTATALAGHQIALTTISTTFMVPLGISSAAAVRVGQALGRGDPRSAMRSGWMALALGAVVMGTSAVVLLTVPGLVTRLFTPEREILAIGVMLLRIAALFQLFDGLQVVATGALRGVGDTRTPMLCHFAGYWLIGLPIGAVLCFTRGWGAAGLWAGLTVGLILIGTFLAVFWSRTARHLPQANWVRGAD